MGLLYIRELRRKKRAPYLVPKLSKSGRIRHSQAGEKKSQEENTTKKQTLLAYTADKATEAPVLGWPAWPWQPTMHSFCDRGEAPRVETSHRITRRGLDNREDSAVTREGIPAEHQSSEGPEVPRTFPRKPHRRGPSLLASRAARLTS